MQHVFQVGDARVTRIDEFRTDEIDPNFLFPQGQDRLREHSASLPRDAYDPDRGTLALSVHAWLVQLPGRTVLIDPGVGNGKNLPGTMFDHWDTPFLDRLAAAGVRPDQVDIVLMSHLHVDHVGWNTRFEDGRWIPTFPKARHVLSRVEQRYNAALEGVTPAPDLPPDGFGPPVTTPYLGVYGESVAPILDAGLADVLDQVEGAEVADGLSLLSTPGHSVDHASVRLRSRGEEALFIVDVMHNPLQTYAPELRSVFCEFPNSAHASRLRILEMAADSGAICFTAHFAGSSAGRISRRGDRFAWQFA